MTAASPGVLFRLNMSRALGAGHAVRCSALAREMRGSGWRTHFLCESSDDAPRRIVSRVADSYVEMPPPASIERDADLTIARYRDAGCCLAVVDMYGITEAYQLKLIEAGVRWLQMDGSGSTPLWADWVLSMSPASSTAAYAPLVRRREGRVLAGPRFALLRPEFSSPIRARRRNRAGKAVFLSLGGGDDRGLLLRIIRSARLERRCALIVVLGDGGPSDTAIRRAAGRRRVVIRRDVAHPSRLMRQATVAIVAGGMTTFELAALGIPMMIVPIALNQMPNTQAWTRLGAAQQAASAPGRLDPGKLRASLGRMLASRALRDRMSKSGRRAVDGLGAARVAALLGGQLSHE